MNRGLEIFEKLIVPITLGLLVYITSSTSNEIMSQQTKLVEIQNERSFDDSKRQLEIKYLELFYSDINSPDANKQSSAIGLLRLMNPELGLQLSEWTKLNVELSAETSDKINKIDKEFINKLNAEKISKQGVSLAGKGKIDKAVTKYDEAIELNPEDFQSYEYKGYAHYRLGELDEAERALRKSIEINNEYVWAYYNLSIVLWSKGEKDEAIDALETLIELDPSFIDVIKGDVQFKKFKTSERFNQLMQ